MLGSLVFGLILFAAGAILLFALKNKLAGFVVMSVGLVIILVTLAVFSFTVITFSVQG